MRGRSLSAIVLARRKLLGLSQREVARGAGISDVWISKIERGLAANVRLPTIMAIFAALDIRTHDPRAIFVAEQKKRGRQS